MRLPVNIESAILNTLAAKRGGVDSPLGWIFAGRYRVWCQVAAEPYAVASLRDGEIKARFRSAKEAIDYAIRQTRTPFEARPGDPIPEIRWRGSDLLTPVEAAERLDVTDRTLRNWSRRGVIQPYFTPGGNRRYRRADVEQLLWLRAQHAAVIRHEEATE